MVADDAWCMPIAMMLPGDDVIAAAVAIVVHIVIAVTIAIITLLLLPPLPPLPPLLLPLSMMSMMSMMSMELRQVEGAFMQSLGALLMERQVCQYVLCKQAYIPGSFDLNDR